MGNLFNPSPPPPQEWPTHLKGECLCIIVGMWMLIGCCAVPLFLVSCAWVCVSMRVGVGVGVCMCVGVYSRNGLGGLGVPHTYAWGGIFPTTLWIWKFRVFSKIVSPVVGLQVWCLGLIVGRRMCTKLRNNTVSPPAFCHVCIDFAVMTSSSTSSPSSLRNTLEFRCSSSDTSPSQNNRIPIKRTSALQAVRTSPRRETGCDDIFAFNDDPSDEKISASSQRWVSSDS